jgi:hypothetical protein
MGSWITTKQILLPQDAKSLSTRNQESGRLGLLMGNMDIPGARHASLPVSECIHIDTGQRPHRGYSRFPPPHNYQLPQPSSTDRLLVAAKDMTDAFQNPHLAVPFASIGDDTIAALAALAAIFKLKLQHAPSPSLKLRLPKSFHAQASFPHPTKSCCRQCPSSGKRDHKRQFTLKTSQMRHYLRGWLHLRCYVNQLRGCPLDPSDSHPATCLKMTSAEWTQPTWPFPSEITIGCNGTTPTQSSTQSPVKKWNTRLP